MAIRSINLAMSASYGAYNQKLTSSTKAKLEELGIVVSENITEAEGKKLLEIAKSQKSNENQKDSNKNQSSNDLFKRAQKLAEKLGIQTDENINFNQLIQIIERKLEEKISINKNNIDALKKLEGLSQELSSIQVQIGASQGYNSTNQALMMSLEMLSRYNKNFLNR